ncbi:preprotein translocase subunit SecE [Xanthovirga aplysinae]|uniref:preprotein translocase subunit SecE n=1 Tax=Xanthovirga aplysinae TaxID=2529853 RepID=UPI0012BC45D2|nr:preprotein translocase subunit SecE [Xanthovirga aplysinae]MTI33003.1 preprotein translocase subunit SecE [Xanthovirga aplysinae]
MITFIKESIEEMRTKVSWPPYSELQRSSGLVVVGCLVFAILLFVIDQGFDNVMSWFYGQF